MSAAASRAVVKASCVPRPSVRPAAAAKPRGPRALRAVELDGDTITLGLAALAGVGFGIGLPVLFTVAEKRDRERIEEIRELNRATLKATGTTLSEVRPHAARRASLARVARKDTWCLREGGARRTRVPHAPRPAAAVHRSRHTFLRLRVLQEEIEEMRPNRYLDRRYVANRDGPPQQTPGSQPLVRELAQRCVAWRLLTLLPTAGLAAVLHRPSQRVRGRLNNALHGFQRTAGGARDP